MKLTTLIENKRVDNRVQCEHGLSFLLQINGLQILFDTGQSDKLISNAQQLNIQLEDIDYVILSHGHYDHTGGLPAFLNINSKAKVIIHPLAFKQRFSRSTKMIKENGIAWRHKMEQYAHRLLFIDEDIELADQVWILTNIKAQKGFEVINERLVCKAADQYVPDVFSDELILVAKDNANPIVICGCAHTGIVNILHEVHQRLQFSNFSVVAGGLHLSGQPDDIIQKTINGIQPFEVEQWALNHCTGDRALELFDAAYPDRVVYSGGGHVISDQ